MGVGVDIVSVSWSFGGLLYALFAEVDWTCVAGLRLSDRRVVLMRQE